MHCKIQSMTIALFIFLLLLPGTILAHDGEHKSQGEDSSSKHYEEGSSMKMQSDKYDDHKKTSAGYKHEKSYEHLDEGSSNKMRYEKHEVHKNVDERDNHGEPYKHLDEGSGMR